MLRSMTAYGRAVTETRYGSISVELLSVNRKHLEVQLFMPRVLNSYDADIRKWIAAAASRGQITVRINIRFEAESPVTVSPNLPLAREFYRAWEAIANDLRVKNGFTLEMLATESGILVQEESVAMEGFAEELKVAVDAALKPFIAMKLTEGKELEKDIVGRLGELGEIIVCIEKLAPRAVEKYRTKLKEAIDSAIPGGVEDERLLREVFLFADRIDITEEIIRFKSHLNQMQETITGKNASGKTLEFILQELGREINTIGSKAADVEVTRFVVAAKTELERIREQVQNVE